MKKLFSSIALIAIFALAAFADVRLPDEKPTPKQKQAKAIDTRLHISLDPNAKEARLRIPKSQVKQLRAELEQLDGADTEATASVSFSRTQTVVSGLFLSLAFVFGGVWFVRSRGNGKGETKTNKTLVVGAGLFLTGAMTTIVFANVGPPPETRNITGKLFSNSVHAYKQASGRIKLEISDESSEIELIVPDVKTPNVTGGEEE
jgi:hypothetical protein